MMRYVVSALAQEEKGPASHFNLAVSVFDSSNGLGVQHLGVSNFIVQDITSETPFTAVELHPTNLHGFYRLSLKTEMKVNAGDYILALVVTSHHPTAGHVPGGMDEGNTMVKIKVV